MSSKYPWLLVGLCGYVTDGSDRCCSGWSVDWRGSCGCSSFWALEALDQRYGITDKLAGQMDEMLVNISSTIDQTVQAVDEKVSAVKHKVERKAGEVAVSAVALACEWLIKQGASAVSRYISRQPIRFF